MTSISLSFYRKSSFGVGIIDFILTFCRRGMVISFHFDLLLGFLILGVSIFSMYLIANTIINIFGLLPLFFFTCTCVIFILISFTILYFIYGECIENGLYYTIKLI